jgi:hypothetical protein
MEVFKRHLDSLPKIGLDYLKENFEEGDVIYEIIGYSRDFGGFHVIKIAQVKPGEFRFFSSPGEPIDKYPRNFDQVFRHLEGSYKVQQVANSLIDPLSVKQKEKREIMIQMGERTFRYKLVKRDGREFELLT